MNTILLVEDTDDIREMIAELLEAEGYLVYQAENGQAALACLERMNGEPGLVLLDLMMPIMNGHELMKVLHESHRLASLPVVILSAGGSASEVEGARRFIRKPADLQTLLSLVREFCGPADP